MGALVDTADQIIARIATAQHGVVTRMQLLCAGVSRRAIARRLDKGSLIRVHPGVYRVGHMAPTANATFIAAVYACGEGAALSGRAAGHLLGLVKGAPGAAALRAVLRGDVHVTLSKLEKAFVELLRNAGLPLPVTNRRAGGRFVDCRWPEHKLTVELDGYRYHSSRHAWEQDRRRERQAYARGDQFRRYTWGDVVDSPRPTLTELGAVLDDH
jgi:very-short-patch-repair endonuclease